MQVRFKQWLCDVEQSSYKNGRMALVLNDAEDGVRIAIATVNIPNEQLDDDEVFIKDYAENAGMTKALVEANIIEEEPTRTVATGFVMVHAFKLHQDFIA